MHNLLNKYYKAIETIEEQKWSSEHEVLESDDFCEILLFKADNPNDQLVVLNPPRAGHHSNIGEPLVKRLVVMGFDAIVINHLPATEKTKNYGMEEIIEEIDMAMVHAEAFPMYDKVHMVGLCQGGWAMTAWAALNPGACYRSLTVAGTPIDFKIDGGKIQMFLDLMPDTFFHNVVESNDGLWPGRYQLDGFKALNYVERNYKTYSDLWCMIVDGDDKGVAKWARNNSWYETVHDLPGKMITDLVIRDLFRGNKLVKGELEVDGERVDLSKITCPVATITGSDDDITLERQCTALHDYVSSDVHIHRSIENCGHIGIYLKKSALDVWEKVITALSV